MLLLLLHIGTVYTNELHQDSLRSMYTYTRMCSLVMEINKATIVISQCSVMPLFHVLNSDESHDVALWCNSQLPLDADVVVMTTRDANLVPLPSLLTSRSS